MGRMADQNRARAAKRRRWRTKCVMCNDRPAKLFPPHQNRMGSTTDPAFCSLRCAAVFAHIEIRAAHHLCPATNQWDFDSDGCEKCRGESFQTQIGRQIEEEEKAGPQRLSVRVGPAPG